MNDVRGGNDRSETQDFRRPKNLVRRDELFTEESIGEESLVAENGRNAHFRVGEKSRADEAR